MSAILKASTCGYTKSSGWRMRSARGFSLIELMIAVAIAGIIMSIALTAYNEFVLRGKQAAAKAVLLDIAQKQPQYLADRRSTYAPTMTELSITAPAEIDALYTFSISLVPSPPGYTAVATPKVADVGTTSFHIDHSGKRVTGVSGVAGTTTW